MENPSRTELLGRISELAPVLQKNALWSDENRQLHKETIDALAEADLLKMRIPQRYGGFESDMRTVVEVIAEVARADGSAGWVASVWAISSWMVGLFPDEVQDEIFAAPDVRVTGILSPSAVVVPTDGGYTLNGKWSFNSGAGQSHWNTNACLRPTPDGGYEPVMVAVPLTDLEVTDDWYTAGLRGTGSITTSARDVFVPEARVLPLGPVMAGQHRSVLNAASALYRAPFMPTACATISAPALGMARAARDAFFERLPGRKLTYTSYENQAEAPITHLQVADATSKIDEAEFHAYRSASTLDSKASSNEQWTLEERAKIRLDLGVTCLRSKEAVDIFNSASGGSSIYSNVPIQRIQRDVQTVNQHAILNPNTNFELFGRVACGLEPNTQYI